MRAMSTSTIVAVDPSTPALEDWHEVLRAAYTQGHEAMWWPSLAHQQFTAAHPHPRRSRARFAAMEGAVCAGALEIVAVLDAPREPVQIQLAVAMDRQGRGIGRELAAHAVRFAAEHGHPILQTEVYAPGDRALQSTRSGRFLRDQGFRVGNVEDRLLLDLPWDGRGDGGAPTGGVRVQSWAGECPRRYEVQWAALKQQMAEDHPVGDLTRADTRVDVERMREDEQRMIQRGWSLVRSMALLEDRPVGFTEMFLDGAEPAIVVQDTTLVDRSVRGSGVGRALKAANLHQLGRLPGDVVARTQHIQTWTSRSNSPMQQLNRQFGFRAVGTMHDAESTLPG